MGSQPARACKYRPSAHDDCAPGQFDPVSPRELAQSRPLPELGERGLDVLEGRFQCRSAAGIRRALRKDVLPLQVQRLPPALTLHPPLLGGTSRFFALKSVAGIQRRSLLHSSHLLLHGFTFPTTSHIFILRAIAPPASHEIMV